MNNRISNSSNGANSPKGSWLLAEELFEAGDHGFVDEICRIDDVGRLGAFAKTWYADRRPEARRLLDQYLQLPLAHYRHESLVKQLFKLAEAAGDDEVMGWFMVMLDQVVRREVVTKHRYDWRSREQWTEQTIRMVPRTELPKTYNPRSTPPNQWATPAQRLRYEQWQGRLRLFSVRTRNYLRRRVWRYFRELGKRDPVRYVAAMTGALPRYQDDACRDGLALMDNWSLVHVMFHDTDVLESTASGWRLGEGKSLSALSPKPIFLKAWTAAPMSLIQVCGNASARPVRQWSLQLLRDHCGDSLKSLSIETILAWLASDDVELADFAADRLKESPETASIDTPTWVRVFDEANSDVLDKVCDVARSHMKAGSLSLDEMLKLACATPAPVVQMSLDWLKQRSVSESERTETLVLVDAKCDAMREPLLAWMIEILRGGEAGVDQRSRLLELLDARQSDVRRAAWVWFTSDAVLNRDISLWQSLMESPYEDVRFGLVDQLRRNEIPAKEVTGRLVRNNGLDANLLRTLWATTLLGIHSGGKHKPAVITAIADRLGRRPDEVDSLLPILTVAVRSIRRTEFRAGLAALVQLIQRRPELSSAVEANFPELQLNLK
ncbi:hypothetical protein [Rubripirellula tenax]|nr:hypothetical protein [Rubripirellula tenax]